MQELRITGGGARGIRLKVPSKETRPATDFLREAVFSHIGTQITGARIIDLFAGSGAYGLEALSRGASSVIAVDDNPRAGPCLKENHARVCKSLGKEPGLRYIKANALNWQPDEADYADILFADPPYDFYKSGADALLARAVSCLKSDAPGLFILEHPADFSDFQVPEGFELKRTIGPKRGKSPAASMFRRLY